MLEPLEDRRLLDLTGPQIIASTPDKHSVASACTVTLTGAGFNDATTVEFIGADASVWTPKRPAAR